MGCLFDYHGPLFPIKQYKYPNSNFPLQNTEMVTLVVATTTDPASNGPATALLSMPGWTPGPNLDQVIISFSCGHLRLVQHDKGIVEEDDLDLRWEKATGESVDEVIFLSKHTAVSNRPALTIHPIGIPHLKEGDVPPQGGRPGWAAPPSPRIGPWLILLKKIAQSHNLIPEFEITLEATHHGPITTKPTMFIEIDTKLIRISKWDAVWGKRREAGDYVKIVKLGGIDRTLGENNGVLNSTMVDPFFLKQGSTEEYWKREDAARVVASLIWEGHGLGEGSAVGTWDSTTPNNKVLLGLGGGHYVPRHMDIIQKDGGWVGHLLSGYSLPMEDPGKAKVKAEDIRGTWRRSIKAAYDATREAFPGGEILAHLDQKSFKGWQKNAITEYLASQNIKVGKPSDFN